MYTSSEFMSAIKVLNIQWPLNDVNNFSPLS